MSAKLTSDSVVLPVVTCVTFAASPAVLGPATLPSSRSSTVLTVTAHESVVEPIGKPIDS